MRQKYPITITRVEKITQQIIDIFDNNNVTLEEGKEIIADLKKTTELMEEYNKNNN